MSAHLKRRAVVGIAVIVPAVALLLALSWQGGAGARPALDIPAAPAAAAPTKKTPRTPCNSTEDCPYTYTFDRDDEYYTSQAQCEGVGQDWCPNQVGDELGCNGDQCDSGSGGQCPTAVVSVLFECYYSSGLGRWVLTCRCFCWVVKK